MLLICNLRCGGISPLWKKSQRLGFFRDRKQSGRIAICIAVVSTFSLVTGCTDKEKSTEGLSVQPKEGASPVAVLAVKSGNLDVSGGPIFDASSELSISKSEQRCLEYVQESRDIGVQDKSIFPIIFQVEHVNIQKAILDAGNLNLTPNEIEKLTVKAFKKYDKLKPLQIKELYLKIQAEEDEAYNAKRIEKIRVIKQKEEDEARVKAESSAKKKQEAERFVGQKLDAWLSGKSEPEGKLPDYGEVTIKSGPKVSSAFINRPGFFQPQEFARYVTDGSRSYFSFDRGGGFANSLFPFDRKDAEDNDEVSNIFWFLPKLKEWSLKFKNLSDAEKPIQFIKEISKDPTQTGDLSIVFFVYDKEVGPGILIWERRNPEGKHEAARVENAKWTEERLKYIRSIVSGGETIKLKYWRDFSWNVENISDEIAEKYGASKMPLNLAETSKRKPSLQLSFLRLGDIYLAEYALARLIELKEKGIPVPVNGGDSDAERKKKALESKLQLE